MPFLQASPGLLRGAGGKLPLRVCLVPAQPAGMPRHGSPARNRLPQTGLPPPLFMVPIALCVINTGLQS